MEVWLTKGMFGEKKEKLADAETPEGAFSALHNWKDSAAAKSKYKVEKYDRFIFGEDGVDEVAVDFGDWSTFVLFSGAGSKAAVKRMFEK